MASTQRNIYATSTNGEVQRVRVFVARKDGKDLDSIAEYIKTGSAGRVKWMTYPIDASKDKIEAAFARSKGRSLVFSIHANDDKETVINFDLLRFVCGRGGNICFKSDIEKIKFDESEYKIEVRTPDRTSLTPAAEGDVTNNTLRVYVGFEEEATIHGNNFKSVNSEIAISDKYSRNDVVSLCYVNVYSTHFKSLITRAGWSNIGRALIARADGAKIELYVRVGDRDESNDFAERINDLAAICDAEIMYVDNNYDFVSTVQGPMSMIMKKELDFEDMDKALDSVSEVHTEDDAMPALDGSINDVLTELKMQFDCGRFKYELKKMPASEFALDCFYLTLLTELPDRFNTAFEAYEAVLLILMSSRTKEDAVEILKGGFPFVLIRDVVEQLDVKCKIVIEEDGNESFIEFGNGISQLNFKYNPSSAISVGHYHAIRVLSAFKDPLSDTPKPQRQPKSIPAIVQKEQTFPSDETLIKDITNEDDRDKIIAELKNALNKSEEEKRELEECNIRLNNELLSQTAKIASLSIQLSEAQEQVFKLKEEVIIVQPHVQSKVQQEESNSNVCADVLVYGDDVHRYLSRAHEIMCEEYVEFITGTGLNDKPILMLHDYDEKSLVEGNDVSGRKIRYFTTPDNKYYVMPSKTIKSLLREEENFNNSTFNVRALIMNTLSAYCNMHAKIEYVLSKHTSDKFGIQLM